MFEIKICINSTKDYSEKTIPILVESLLESGISSNNIFVIEGGYKKREIIKKNTHVHILTNHNSIDYTGLIDIVENEMESDYWFNIHDTCRVGRNFKELLQNIPESFPDKIALAFHPSMNIGSYKYSYLKQNKNKLLHLKNTDYSRETIQYWKKKGAEIEDYLLHKSKDSSTLVYNCNLLTKINIIKENWYGTETKRITEYYSNLDLYKSKSNWNRKSWMEIDL